MSPVLGARHTGGRRGVGAIATAAAWALAALFGNVATEAAGSQPWRFAKPSSLVQTVAVFGSDDRVNIPKRLERVADKVGLLFNNRLRTVCTAFCVGENLIATAAHCLGRGGTTAARYSDFTFSRSYDKRRDAARIEGANNGSAAQNVASGNFKLRVHRPIDAAFDWAIVKLHRDACPAGGLRVRVKSGIDLIGESQAGRVFQIAYHRDWAQWRPAYSKPCLVARDFDGAPWANIAPDFLNADQMVLHTCDTGGASSGSPMLLETDDGPVVIGINVGTYDQSKLPEGQQPAKAQAHTIANTAVNAEVFAAALEAMRTQHILASGPPMRELQERLAALGHYNGTIDGAYGPALKAAIEIYEYGRQLPQIGLATQSLLTRLAREQGRSGAVTPSSARQPQPVR